MVGTGLDRGARDPGAALDPAGHLRSRNRPDLDDCPLVFDRPEPFAALLGCIQLWHRDKQQGVIDRALVVAGLASGFAGTTTGVGGPPMALTYQNSDPATMRATISASRASALTDRSAKADVRCRRSAVMRCRRSKSWAIMGSALSSCCRSGVTRDRRRYAGCKVSWL